MGHPVKKQYDKEAFTYADYLTWENDDQRVEIIEGGVYDMSPAPSTNHQIVATNLVEALNSKMKENGCRVLAAPFDVRLDPRMKSVKDNEDDDVKTVVQPDISVYCDQTKLDDKGGAGAPDLVVEILSPHTQDKDMSVKLILYMKNQVPEYWIVGADKQSINQFVLDDEGFYELVATVGKKDKLRPRQFQDVKLDLSEVFDY